MVQSQSQFRGFNNLPLAIAAFQKTKVEYLEHLGKAMVEEIDKGFDRGEDALGRPWQPLKDGTGQILIDSGRMRESITYQVDEDNMDVAVGGDVEYLAPHEFGAPSVGLPRRPILQPAMTWAESRLIDPMADRYIGGGFDSFVRKGGSF